MASADLPPDLPPDFPADLPTDLPPDLPTSRQVDFFFGPGSRYAYLAATQIAHLEHDTGCVVTWWPMSSGDLMNRRGQNPFAGRNAAGDGSGVAVSGQYNEQYRRQDLARWAALYNVPYTEPKAPAMTAARRTLYCVAAALHGRGTPYARAMFASIHADGAATTEDICLNLGEKCGIPAKILRDTVESGAAQRSHEEIIALALKYNVFGVPSFVVDGELFWGNDRLVLLHHYLMRS